ncbi:hypothetical protein [Pseudomonas veronii]|uniref:Uncharacterized protein n=1 Tax=Pseudomonas veronii TaxID=76761 RepID=A0A3S0NRC3_PSEVE|nr:hypothetical protein [Pseudomonas veronii]QIM56526.1 hypothetical protein E4167_35845 [Pseudomonas veronii]RTY62922.1 hypothetical protein EKA83_33710 [Pseudomonas veronii]
MSDKTIQVKSWGEGQGDFVLINESDFDENFHELFGSKKLSAKEVKAAKLLDDTKAALTEKGIAFEDGADQATLQALLDQAA